MKNLSLLLILLSLVGCHNKTILPKDRQSFEKSQKTTPKKPIKKLPKENQKPIKESIKILVTTHGYRDWEDKNETDILTTDWIDLHQKKGVYYLSKADYKIERYVDDCSGYNTSVIHSKNNTLLLINKPDLKLGEIKNITIKKKHIWTNEKVTYHFNNIEYTLRAEGEIISPEKEHLDENNIKNYKLYISTNNSVETLFLEEASFNDTFVELLFVGDIDNDGKLGFIFGASRNYEEERVILFLSSKAEKEKIIKKVGEIAIQFDC